MTRAVRVWLIGLFILGLPIAGFSRVSAAGEEAGPEQVVTGTLIKLDLKEMKGLIKTDLGKPIFFEVTKPHLFDNLSVGSRVTLQIDSHGRADKVTDASTADFLPPEELTTGSIRPIGQPLIGMTR